MVVVERGEELRRAGGEGVSGGADAAGMDDRGEAWQQRRIGHVARMADEIRQYFRKLIAEAGDQDAAPAKRGPGLDRAREERAPMRHARAGRRRERRRARLDEGGERRVEPC